MFDSPEQMQEMNDIIMRRLAHRRYPWLTEQQAVFRMAADEFAPPPLPEPTAADTPATDA